MTLAIEKYPSYQIAAAVVSNLETSGIAADDISIIANDADEIKRRNTAENMSEDAGSGAAVGAAVGTAGGLLAGLGLVSIPGIGPVVAAGWLVATLAGAATGAVLGAATGGLYGAFTTAGLDETTAQMFADHVRAGGTLVCVDTNADDEAKVRAILSKHALPMPRRMQA
jgi:hypothetical protein